MIGVLGVGIGIGLGFIREEKLIGFVYGKIRDIVKEELRILLGFCFV